MSLSSSVSQRSTRETSAAPSNASTDPMNLNDDEEKSVARNAPATILEPEDGSDDEVPQGHRATISSVNNDPAESDSELEVQAKQVWQRRKLGERSLSPSNPQHSGNKRRRVASKSDEESDRAHSLSSSRRSPSNPVHEAYVQPVIGATTTSSSSFEPSSILPPIAAAGYLSTEQSPQSTRSATTPPFDRLVPPGREYDHSNEGHDKGVEEREHAASNTNALQSPGAGSSKQLEGQGDALAGEAAIQLLDAEETTALPRSSGAAALEVSEDDSVALHPSVQDDTLIKDHEAKEVTSDDHGKPAIDEDGDVNMSSPKNVNLFAGTTPANQDNAIEDAKDADDTLANEPTPNATLTPNPKPNTDDSQLSKSDIPPIAPPVRPVWNPADWIVDTASAAKARHANRASKPVSSSVPTSDVAPKAKSKKDKAEKEKKVTRHEEGEEEVERAGTPVGGKEKVKAKKEVKKVKQKPKSKIDDLKTGNKHRGSTVSHDSPAVSSPAASSIPPSPEQTREPSPDEDDARVFCICRRPYGDEDEGTTMIACDNGCDNWFHPACVGVKEDQCDLIDTYICPLCEPHTSLRTIIKQRCKREGCDNAVKRVNSKFCSDLCGFRYAQALVEGLGNKKTVASLSNTFCNYPRPSHVRVVHHLPPSSPTVQSDNHLLAVIQNQLGVAQRSLELVRKRQNLLRQVIARCLALQEVAVNGDEGDEDKPRKGKKEGKRQGVEDKPCGWDRRLIWSDEEVQDWDGMDDAVDAELNDLVCKRGKRRCDRHQGWQKTIAVSLEVEEAQLIRRKESLEDQKSEIKAELELQVEGKKVKDALAGRLGSDNGTLA
ncbi:hypothetical protein BCR39DRAFT_555779 [Naematelia encephala]|uniref:PHD-type domain-containing protein n=1 Tax=Naematelia encephala TaxID=71784 RepID=A0A1Y2BLM4_9TREE|nr:hypothetical protein BCR39DRAFT_555779 [Naematelia encephala]